MNEREEKFTLLYIQRAQKKKDLVFICTRTVIPKGAPHTYTNNCHLVKIFPFCNLSATKRKIPSGCCTVKLQLYYLQSPLLNSYVSLNITIIMASLLLLLLLFQSIKLVLAAQRIEFAYNEPSNCRVERVQLSSDSQWRINPQLNSTIRDTAHWFHLNVCTSNKSNTCRMQKIYILTLATLSFSHCRIIE